MEAFDGKDDPRLDLPMAHQSGDPIEASDKAREGFKKRTQDSSAKAGEAFQKALEDSIESGRYHVVSARRVPELDEDWMSRSHPECVQEIYRLQRCYDAVRERAERAERATQRVMEERNQLSEKVRAYAKREIEMVKRIEEQSIDRGLRTILHQNQQDLITRIENLSAAHDKLMQLNGKNTEIIGNALSIIADGVAELLKPLPDEQNVLSDADVVEIRKSLGEEWLRVECDDDIVKGVQLTKAMLDEFYEKYCKLRGKVETLAQDDN